MLEQLFPETSMALSALWRWDGEIGRAQYIGWGCLLVGLKYGIDRLLFHYLLGVEWTLLSYLGATHLDLMHFGSEKSVWSRLVILISALPFLVAGIHLSIRRLRSAGLPLYLAFLFVVPGIKWFLFLLLALVPPRFVSQVEALPANFHWRSLIPKSFLGSVILSLLLTALISAAATAVTIRLFRNYGWSLFAGIPFMLGFTSAILHSFHVYRTRAQCFGVAMCSLLLTGLILLLVAIEGMVCIVMASPLVVGIGLTGAYFGWLVQRHRPIVAQVYCAAILALPLMWLTEQTPSSSPDYAVTSRIVVAAPIHKVWREVIDFKPIPRPRELLFRLGVAYPIRAEIVGQGVGAVRYCHFSTGAFVEPIEIWDEPRLLHFSVRENPRPMTEWHPFARMEAPHLDGFLVSRRGQFKLTELLGGRTELEGTTWYRHGMFPAAYWRLWSDWIIHQIHGRVLRHIQQGAEADGKPVARH